MIAAGTHNVAGRRCRHKLIKSHVVAASAATAKKLHVFDGSNSAKASDGNGSKGRADDPKEPGLGRAFIPLEDSHHPVALSDEYPTNISLSVNFRYSDYWHI